MMRVYYESVLAKNPIKVVVIFSLNVQLAVLFWTWWCQTHLLGNSRFCPVLQTLYGEPLQKRHDEPNEHDTLSLPAKPTHCK